MKSFLAILAAVAVTSVNAQIDFPGIYAVSELLRGSIPEVFEVCGVSKFTVGDPKSLAPSAPGVTEAPTAAPMGTLPPDYEATTKFCSDTSSSTQFISNYASYDDYKLANQTIAGALYGGWVGCAGESFNSVKEFGVCGATTIQTVVGTLAVQGITEPNVTQILQALDPLGDASGFGDEALASICSIILVCDENNTLPADTSELFSALGAVPSLLQLVGTNYPANEVGQNVVYHILRLVKAAADLNDIAVCSSLYGFILQNVLTNPDPAVIAAVFAAPDGQLPILNTINYQIDSTLGIYPRIYNIAAPLYAAALAQVSNPALLADILTLDDLVYNSAIAPTAPIMIDPLNPLATAGWAFVESDIVLANFSSPTGTRSLLITDYFTDSSLTNGRCVDLGFDGVGTGQTNPVINPGVTNPTRAAAGCLAKGLAIGADLYDPTGIEAGLFDDTFNLICPQSMLPQPAEIDIDFGAGPVTVEACGLQAQDCSIAYPFDSVATDPMNALFSSYLAQPPEVQALLFPYKGLGELLADWFESYEDSVLGVFEISLGASGPITAAATQTVFPYQSQLCDRIFGSAIGAMGASATSGALDCFLGSNGLKGTELEFLLNLFLFGDEAQQPQCAPLVSAMVYGPDGGAFPLLTSGVNGGDLTKVSAAAKRIVELLTDTYSGLVTGCTTEPPERDTDTDSSASTLGVSTLLAGVVGFVALKLN